MTVPQHKWMWSVVDEQACHVRRYTRSELMEKVSGAGLKVEYVSSFVSFLLPLMWLSRKIRIGKSDQPTTEFSISFSLNKILKWFMKIEIAILKFGIKLPFGGSLIMVARKPCR